MPDYQEHAAGTFCWAELVTTDAGGAKEFYCDLFGWTFHDDPVGEGKTYTMLQRQGKSVGALYQRNAEQTARGVPPHWSQYVSVADVDAAERKVRDGGGRILAGPFDVLDIGRMAVCQDPTGAVFSLWQPRRHIGAQVKGDPGSLCWHELQTRDTAAAGRFYGMVFGWEAQTQRMGATDYTSFMCAGQPAAGMLAIQKEWGEVPPNWLPYFAVGDCDASALKATRLGATLLVPPTAIPGVGRFAVVQDPQGAVFGVVGPGA
jgi:predicted enzyme related to lactoylglutathione lyase